MKRIKVFLLTVALTIIFNISAFAASGFEFLVNANFGVGIGIPTKSMKDEGFKNGYGLDCEATFQFGYAFQVKDNFAISFLGEFGYGMSSYAISGKMNAGAMLEDIFVSMFGSSFKGLFNDITNDISISMDNTFDIIQIGLFPKLNFGAFAIGIGGGVKIPISCESIVTIAGEESKTKLTRSDIVDMFSPPIFGYVKTSFDYSFYITEKIAFKVGLYLGYNIMKFKASEGEKDEYGGTFNVGLELGWRFGPMHN